MNLVLISKNNRKRPKMAKTDIVLKKAYRRRLEAKS